MGYPLQNMTQAPETKVQPKRRKWWLVLLALPYIGLCFPQIYARPSPALWGFPFFYWYQFAWVIAASVLMGIVYRQYRTRKNDAA
jgi:hypothetical protein